MPNASNRTKKALQEISKVFKLASRLTTDITQAVREIENLQRQVQKLRTVSGGNPRPTKSPHVKSGNRAVRTGKTHSEHSQTRRESSKPSNASDFVFPKEPFNPPPPEPTTHPGNN